MNSLLVTGAGGFVGTKLCERLVVDGHKVRAAFRTTPAVATVGEPVTVGEIGPATDWGEALAGIDTVLHLAARVHLMHDCAADPLAEFRRVNVAGTLNLARQAAAAGVKRLVFLSSVKANGEATQPGHPFTVSDPPAPEDPYGISKREAEEGLSVLAAETGLEVVVLRLPLVYGPGVKANFLRLLQWVDKGIPLPLARVANQRSMIYLGNLVDAIVECAENPRAAGRTFLVSDGEDVSTPDLIREIAAAMNRRPRLVPVPARALHGLGRLLGREGEVRRLTGSLAVDGGAIRETLNWRPPFTLTEGIRETVSWYLEKA